MGKIIDIIIQAQDRASKEFRKLRSELEALHQVGSSIQDVGQSMMAVGAGISAGLGLAIKSAGDFEQAVVDLGAVMGRQYGQMQDLSNIAREFGRTTTSSATEAAQAMQLVASYGYEEASVLKQHTAVALKLATAQSYDLNMTTEILISTMKNFQKQGYSSAKVADILVQASNKSSASMEKFRYSLKYVAPIANTLGMSLEDMVAQMSMLYDAGLSAETVGTSLRGIWESLVNPTNKAKEVLEKYGLTLDEVNPKTQDMADILDRLKGMKAQDLFQVFGVESAPAIMAMLDQGSQKLRQLRKDYENAGGALDKQYNTKMKTFNNQMKIAKNNLQDVAIEIGNQLLPLATQLAQKIQQLAHWFQSLSPETKKMIAYTLLWTSGLLTLGGTTLFVIGTIIRIIRVVKEFSHSMKGILQLAGITRALKGLGTVFGMLKNGFMSVLRVLGIVVRFLFTNPIGIAITIIVGLLILLYEAWTNNWGGIQQKTQAVWNWLVNVFNSISNSIGQFINSVVTWFQNFDLMATLQSAWGGLVQWASSIWSSIKNTIYNFLLGILMDTGQTSAQARQTLVNAWNNIKIFINAILTVIYWVTVGWVIKLWQFMITGMVWIKNAIIQGWTQIKAWLAPYLNGLKQLINSAWNTIKSWTASFLNWLRPIWSSTWNFIKSFTMGAWNVIKSVISVSTKVMSALIKGALMIIKAIWNSVWAGIKAYATSIWNSIKTIIKSAINIIKNIIALAINLIAGNWRQAWNNVQNIARNAWTIIKTIVTGGLKAVISAMRSFISTAWSSGKALMDAFARGIKSAVGTVTSAVESVVAKARRYFGFSDAKEGPFSNITYSGFATMSAFAKGATQAKSLLARSIGGTIQSALAGGTAGAFGINQVGGMALAGGGVAPSPQQNFNITINIQGNASQADAKFIVRQVIDAIQREMRR